MGMKGLLGVGAVCSLSVGLLFACGGDGNAGLPGSGGVAGSGGANSGGAGGTSSGGTSSGGSAGSGGNFGGAAGAGGASGGTGAVDGGGAGGTGPTCNSKPTDDQDKDGFTGAEGDCDDCDPKVNPGAIEAPTKTGATPKDDDCNGKVDDLPAACDDAVALDEPDPAIAAKSIELCKKPANDKDWGLVSAKWTLPDGVGIPTGSEANYHLGHGALSAFGTNGKVQAGKRMLGLSSGTARQPADPGYQDVSGFDKGFKSASPPGYPKESPACPNVTTGEPHDGVALEVMVRAPTNAVAFSFDSNFYTFEWPSYVCSEYNDFFLALMAPTPAGLADPNVLYDAQANLISVNSALLDVCGCASGPPCTAGTKSYSCAQGPTLLAGTGFGKDSSGGVDHGATGWLVTTVPVEGGKTFSMRFTVHDSSDGILDSTALVDNFTWLFSDAPSKPTTIAKP